MRLRMLPWLLVAAAAGFAAAGLGRVDLGSVDLGAAVAKVAPALTVRSATSSAPSATGTAPSATGTATDTALAVRDAIRLSNDAQAKAFATGDDTVMRSSGTTSFYQQMVQTNADLRSAGVTSISLVDLTFESVSVTGDSATATTLETWRATYADGSSDQSTDRNVYTLVRQNGAWKVDTDEQPQAAVTAPTTPTVPADPAVPVTSADSASTSSNWSGYAAGNGTYTSVSGTWVVPTVSTATPGADATWVGIGGLTSNDLIQAGTQATVSGGTVVYQAWTEMLPASSRTVALSVTAGDTVTVTISERSAGLWDIVMRNDTTGERYSTTVRYASTRTSAEWIQEVPSVGRGSLPLDAFGTLRFTSATAVRDGAAVDLTSSGARAITMINGAGQALAQPSAIGTDGGFTVTRTDAPSGGYPQGRGHRG